MWMRARRSLREGPDQGRHLSLLVGKHSKSTSNLVHQTSTVMVTDFNKSSKQPTVWWLVSAPSYLGAQLEDSEHRGQNPLKDIQCPCLVFDADCWLRSQLEHLIRSLCVPRLFHSIMDKVQRLVSKKEHWSHSITPAWLYWLDTSQTSLGSRGGEIDFSS